MTVALRLFILTVFFVYRIFGSDDVVCVPVEGGNERCVESFNGVRENILLLNQTIKENLDKLNKHCQEFEKCSESLKCGAEKELIDLVDDVNAFCEASMFRHTPLFEECDGKLTVRNSTCVNDWNPLPALEDVSLLNEDLRKTACNELFGKDNCLEKEMSEACGVEVWNGFKKNQLAMIRITGSCKFD